jgi:hypothetical protein
MDQFAEGFLAPCLWGGKEKRSAYLLYSEGAEDILIQSHYVPTNIVIKGGKIRVYGEIKINNDLKELHAESFVAL